MVDHGLLALERAFRTTGTLTDEVAWLRARLRSGRLERERLELAAWLGHPAAREVAGPDVRDFHAPPHAFPATGPLAELRGGIAALNRVLAPDERSPVELAEDWLACPCEEHAAAAQERHDRLSTELDEEGSPLSQAVVFLLGSVVDGLSSEPLGELDDDSPEARLMKAILGDIPPSTYCAMDVLFRAMTGGAEQGTSVDAVLEAVRAELVPWLLGHSDPVRERVAARASIRT
jgi:hypothetical protein